MSSPPHRPQLLGAQLSIRSGDRQGSINMNRTGDLYMNRIAFAVKSALGLVMLAPPALVYAAAAPDAALEEIVVTGIRKSVEESIEAKRAATDLVEVITAEDIGTITD